MQGFIPDGSGPAGSRYGRTPPTKEHANGLAYKRDGTPRKPKVTLSLPEKLAKAEADMAAAKAKAGREAFAKAGVLGAALTKLRARFARVLRRADSLDTPEKVEVERERLEAALDALDAFPERAASLRAAATPGIEAIDGLALSMTEATLAGTEVPAIDKADVDALEARWAALGETEADEADTDESE